MEFLGAPTLIPGDRRKEQRYALGLQLHFSFVRRGATLRGSGVTVDLSRRGILFLTDDPPPDKQNMELRLAWPILLQGVCPLELVARGTIVRTDSRGTLFEVRDYAFHTCGTRSFAEPAVAGATYNVVG